MHLESGHQESETAMGELMFSLKVVEVEIEMSMEEVDGELAACRFFHSTKEVAEAEYQLRKAQARCVHAASAPRQACQCHARGHAQAMHVNTICQFVHVCIRAIACVHVHVCMCMPGGARRGKAAGFGRARCSGVNRAR